MSSARADPNLLPQLHVMQQQENSPSYRCNDYMSTTHVVTPIHREALCHRGYYTIATYVGITPSTCATAISYFDRFLSSSSPTARRALLDLHELQLAFIVCLVIAVKSHAEFKVEPDYVSNVFCGNVYTPAEINCMEREILQALSWRLTGPTAHDFIEYFLEMTAHLEGDERTRVFYFSKGLVDFAMPKYNVAIRRPSELAFTVISCAVQYVGLGSLECLPSLQMVSGFDLLNDPELVSLYQTMTGLIREWIASVEHLVPRSQQNDTTSVVPSV